MRNVVEINVSLPHLQRLYGMASKCQHPGVLALLLFLGVQGI